MRTPLAFAVVAALAGLVRAIGAAPGGVSLDDRKPLAVDGLRDPVDVLRDRWGVHHIYAKNEHDLFFTQGYTAARDRLFQFELWRRQATGTVAEILGRKELKRDIGTRLHMFRGDLKAELNWYHPHGEAIITAYVEGVNAYIAEARRNPASLPVEFQILGITPAPWTPEVVISRHNGLLANIGEELNMAQAVRLLGAAKVKDLEYFQGGDPDITPDPAIDLSLLKYVHVDPKARTVRVGPNGLLARLRQGVRPRRLGAFSNRRQVGGVHQPQHRGARRVLPADDLPVAAVVDRAGQDARAHQGVAR